MKTLTHIIYLLLISSSLLAQDTLHVYLKPLEFNIKCEHEWGDGAQGMIELQLKNLSTDEDTTTQEEHCLLQEITRLKIETGNMKRDRIFKTFEDSTGTVDLVYLGAYSIDTKLELHITPWEEDCGSKWNFNTECIQDPDDLCGKTISSFSVSEVIKAKNKSLIKKTGAFTEAVKKFGGYFKYEILVTREG